MLRNLFNLILIAFLGVFGFVVETAFAQTETPLDPTPAYRIDEVPSIPALADGSVRPPTPEEASDQLAEASDHWFYGRGVGNTLVTVGSVVAFPPVAIYYAGNAALALGGYEPVYVSDALPDESREEFNTVFNEVTSVPGRFNAAMADRDFYEATPQLNHAQLKQTTQASPTQSKAAQTKEASKTAARVSSSPTQVPQRILRKRYLKGNESSAIKR